MVDKKSTQPYKVTVYVAESKFARPAIYQSFVIQRESLDVAKAYVKKRYRASARHRLMSVSMCTDSSLVVYLGPQERKPD